MSIVVPFPSALRAEMIAQEEEDQVQAIRAMLRYLQRETQQCGLAGTTEMLGQAIQALDRDALDR